MMKISKEVLIQQILSKINAFEQLESKSTNVKNEITEAGQFKILVAKKDTCVEILHSWKDTTFSFSNPGTIDVYFKDLENHATYVIFMTDCDLELFPSLLGECYELGKAFLNKEYVLETKKRLWGNKYKLIFSTPTTYRIATKI